MHFTVCDFLLDLIQNSVEAEAACITLCLYEDGRLIDIKIIDNGKGMNETELKRIRDPFYTDGLKHAKRKVGLGIPFLLQALDLAGGNFDVSSLKGSGTTVAFSFPADAIDTPPMGDVPGLILSAMCFDGDYEFIAKRRNANRGLAYEVKRSEILDAVGSLHDAASLVLAREFLISQEET